MSKRANASVSDPKLVEKNTLKAKERRRRELNDIRSTLANAHGRRLLWRLLTKCRTFETIWDSSARIHYNSGQQDIGHFIMAEIVEADENLLLKMMKENKKE